MRYSRTNADAVEVEFNPNINLDQDLNFDEDEALIDGIEPLRRGTARKEKEVALSIQARRAIEEHFERKKLHKELDYLFDEDFEHGMSQGPSEEE